MPAGSNRKREREYEELKGEFKKEGRYKGREDEVAARIVNKQRARAGETKSSRSASTTRRRSSDTRSPSRGRSRTTRTSGSRTARSNDGSRSSRTAGGSRMRREGSSRRRESTPRTRTAASPDAGLPIKNYDAQPVAKIQQRLSKLSLADLRKVRAYEQKHKDRATLLRRIERAEEEHRGSGARASSGKAGTRGKSAGRAASRSRGARASSNGRSASPTRTTRGPSRNGGASRSRTAGSRNGRSTASRSRSNGTGSSQTTTDHETIRRWAEARGAEPVTVRGTGKDDEAGVLRLDFPGYSGKERFQSISWDEFFEKFDQKKLQFLYQDRRKNGEQSNFFKLIAPGSRP